MTTELKSPVLHVTDVAYLQILAIRSDYDSAFPDDRADILAVGRGYHRSKSEGTAVESIAVGFFRRSEVTPIHRSNRRLLRDLPYIVLGTPETKLGFEGKTLDYESARSFFLR